MVEKEINKIMNEERGFYEKAKEEMKLSERILAELPGFRGYKEKELRRESDKLLRNHIYRRLMEAKRDLKEVFQRLSDHRVHEVLTDMDRFLMRFDRVSEKINHASYGYAGFFNILKVEEEKLDKMVAFDNELLRYVEKIVSETNVLKDEVMKEKFEKTREHLQSLNNSLEALEEKFDERQEVILGVK
jgi:hypothetical protein